MFATGAEQAVFAVHAQRVSPSAILYTINPRRECFLSPSTSVAPDLPETSIEGIRGVMDSAYEVGSGVSSAVQRFRASWRAAFSSDPILNRKDGNAMFGHDAAQILFAALRRTRTAGVGDVQATRDLLCKALSAREPCPGMLLSSGMFTAANELILPVKRIELRGGRFLEFEEQEPQ